jgi:hypothetical protein
MSSCRVVGPFSGCDEFFASFFGILSEVFIYNNVVTLHLEKGIVINCDAQKICIILYICIIIIIQIFCASQLMAILFPGVVLQPSQANILYC